MTLIFEIGLMALMTPSGTSVSDIYTPRFFMSGGRFLTSASLFLTGVFGLIKMAASLSFMLYGVRIGEATGSG